VGVLKIRGKWGIEWYDVNGQRKRKVIEKPGEKIDGGWFEAAKKTYRDTKSKLDRGEPLPFTTSKKALADVAEKYYEVCKGTWSPTEADRVRTMLDLHILPFFGATRPAKDKSFEGGKKISAVKQLYVEEYIAQRQTEGAAPATINKEVARLRHLFNKAIAWGEVPRNPCAGIRHLKEPPARVAYLEPHERAMLLTECAAFDPVLLAIVSVAMLTGARLSEILALTWGNADLSRRILTFRKTKSGRIRHVPMNPDLHNVLSRLDAERTGSDAGAPLFPPEWNSRRVTTAFRRLTNGENCRGRIAVKPGFRFHDLRHDFASWLTMNGVAIRGVQTLLGHADLRMTERYSHLAERVLAAAVAVLPQLPTTPIVTPEQRNRGGEISPTWPIRGCGKC
jgi:integrase